MRNNFQVRYETMTKINAEYNIILRNADCKLINSW